MSSRMKKYNSVDQSTSRRRLEKNRSLYDNLYTKASYTEFSDLDHNNVIDLSDIDENTISNRSEYHRIKGATGLISKEKLDYESDPLRSYSFFEDDRDYDINSVLEKAKLNRSDIDELEKKRKLRTSEYNILEDLTDEKLKKYQDQKKEVLSKEDEEELEELIHTITSNTMRAELDQQLLADLLPSELDETLVDVKLDESDSDHFNETNVKLDQSFFTKSIELSDEDLTSIEESPDETFVIEEKVSLFKKVLLAVIIIIVIIFLCFVTYHLLFVVYKLMLDS
ncbi:MAG: hypothetical protein PUB18_02470 [bacterium]|nr:hypothetical protein [bacterium]